MKKTVTLLLIIIVPLLTSSVYSLTSAQTWISSVKVYKHCDYRGSNATLPPGSYTEYDLLMKGIGNDQMSSISVPKGLIAILYEHDDFKGRSWVFGRDEACFLQRGLNDKVSSVIVAEKGDTDYGVKVFKHCDYKGSNATLPPGSYTKGDLLLKGIGNDQMSSISVPNGLKATLYEHDHFRGKSWVFRGDESCFVKKGLNDKVSSVVVELDKPEATLTLSPHFL